MPKKIRVEMLKPGTLAEISATDRIIRITMNTGKAGEFYRVPVKASKIFGYTIPDSGGIVEKFATHHNLFPESGWGKDWVMSHFETGRGIGYGKTQKEAIVDGIRRLDYHSRKLVATLQWNRDQLAAGKEMPIPEILKGKI